MQVVFGTKDDILIINHANNEITIRTFVHKWFSGETTETTVTFPIFALDKVQFVVPTIFKRGSLTFTFDDADLITRKLSMPVQYKNKDSVARLTRDLQNKRYFT